MGVRDSPAETPKAPRGAEKCGYAGRVAIGDSGMSRILVSGASGLIGRALVPSFEGGNAEIVRLVRGRAQSASEISWDPMVELPPAAVSGCDTVIHLAGESVVGRWTA